METTHALHAVAALDRARIAALRCGEGGEDDSGDDGETREHAGRGESRGMVSWRGWNWWERMLLGAGGTVSSTSGLLMGRAGLVCVGSVCANRCEGMER